jgi:predicted short-subunit dehydrogenase-like oxidoreductase (DUF2520 family)
MSLIPEQRAGVFGLQVGIAGCGKVGTSLALALTQAGVAVSAVYSRTLNRAEQLATLVNASIYQPENAEISLPNVDVWIVAVNDDNISEVVQLLNVGFPESLIAHTSGGCDTTQLQPLHPRVGVFYPLQTFSEFRLLDWSEIPVFVSSMHHSDTAILHALAATITMKAVEIKEEDRAIIHLAAVFINNFVNAMSAIALDILKQKQLDFYLLMPLLDETVEKIRLSDPLNAQTGPAMRGDLQTIDRHLGLLNQFPHEYKEVYQTVSDLITKYLRKDS